MEKLNPKLCQVNKTRWMFETIGCLKTLQKDDFELQIADQIVKYENISAANI